jgi:hypothetical protein
MANLYIPLTNAPNQIFNLTTEVNGDSRKFTVELIYLDKAGYWSLSLIDRLTKQYYFTHLPMLAGEGETFNLIECHQHLLVGGIYIVPMSRERSNDSPEKESWGAEYFLVWGDNHDFDLTEPA